ncbi:MAG: protoheme IX farnesyltransferase [Chloroflexi bacterium]|nr:protoheme IX farnesyltransferase [Chloroflexota bacterium]|tara:strand:- start:42937 stop:43830 length:894 start_codon:yes stop_codon:yes gene_type:complete
MTEKLEKKNNLVIDLIYLTKPKVMSLLLMAALAGVFIGSENFPSLKVIIGVFIGGICASGGSGAINMGIEKNIDINMNRTKNRPVAEGRISPLFSVIYGIILNLISFVILFYTTNLLAAVLAITGTLLYVILYTIILKPNTDQNIVIGGASGSIPPVVGYVAAGNGIDIVAIYLFMIIFLWTPPHFWALAIMIKDDYERAKIPMLPNIKGEKNTSIQMMFYTIILSIFVISFTFVTDRANEIYLFGSSILCVLFIYYSIKLIKNTNKESALNTYKYSLLFLTLVWVLMIVTSIEKNI